MKIEFEYVISLMIFVSYNFICVADSSGDELIPTIPIGAFFHEGYSQARLIFDYVLYKVNFNPDSLHFTDKVEIVSPEDTFESSQLICGMSAEGIAAIVAPSSINTAPIMESTCSNLRIPHIQISRRPSTSANVYMGSSTLLNFFPEPELLNKGIGIIAEHLHWKSFVVLYQNADSLIKIQNILKLQNFAANAKQNDILIKELGPGPDYKPALKVVQGMTTERRFVLECEAENILDILQQAKDLKLLEYVHQYFLTSLDAHTVDLSVLNTSANITTIRMLDPENSEFALAVREWQRYAEIKNIDMDLEPYSVKTETALMYDALNQLVNTVNEYQNTYGPIEVESLECFGEKEGWNQGVSLASMMKKVKGTFGITGPLEFDVYGRRTNFTLYLVEGNRNNTQASWTPSDGENITFFLSETERLSTRLRNLEKNVLIVSSRVQAPYLREKKDGVGDDKYEGFSMDLMNALAEEMKSEINVTFKFDVRKNLGYGRYVEENKSWDGIIGEILAGRADLGICDLTITHQRREVVDFSTPFMRLGISILHKNPEEKVASTFAFLAPFSIDLWIYSATLYLALTIAYYFITRMSPPDWENPNPKDENPEELENIWDLKNSLWLSLGTIMNQGCDIVPKGISSRMAAAMWWFFAIIVTNSYIANLTAFLTTANMESTITSAQDLAKQTKIKYGVLKGGSTEVFFRDSNYSTFQKMWIAMQQAEPTVFEDSNEEGVNRVLNTKQGHYAYLMESTTLEYNLYTNCELRKVGDPLDSKGYGIAMPLDYPLRTRINTAILEMQAKGIINKLKDRWWKEKREGPICPAKSEEEKDAGKLSLEELAGVFIVLGVGVALAYVVAIGEFLWNVRNVSVEEHISFWQVLNVELVFAVSIWETKKRVKPLASESSSSHSEGKQSRSRSIARSVLQGAESLLGLNILKNESSNQTNY